MMNVTNESNDVGVVSAAEAVKPELTTDDVMMKIDELVNVAQYLKRVAKPMLRKIAKRKLPRAATNRRNGFAVPVTMREQLVKFLNKAYPNNNDGKNYTTTTVLPRTDVTQLVTRYIKERELQLSDNRKNFSMDAPLAAAFGVDPGTISNWFELQKYLASIITSTKNADADSASTAPVAPAVGAVASPAPSASDKPSKRIKKG